MFCRVTVRIYEPPSTLLGCFVVFYSLWSGNGHLALLRLSFRAAWASVSFRCISGYLFCFKYELILKYVPYWPTRVTRPLTAWKTNSAKWKADVWQNDLFFITKPSDLRQSIITWENNVRTVFHAIFVSVYLIVTERQRGQARILYHFSWEMPLA